MSSNKPSYFLFNNVYIEGQKAVKNKISNLKELYQYSLLPCGHPGLVYSSTGLLTAFEYLQNYRQRKILEQTGQSAYFLAVVFIQWINVLTCRSRRYSIFQDGMKYVKAGCMNWRGGWGRVSLNFNWTVSCFFNYRNWVMNFALVFEFGFAMLLIYTPGMEVALRFRPLRYKIRRHPCPWVVSILDIRRSLVNSFCFLSG